MSDKRATIGLHNPQSPMNMGAILRAAGCYGADEILYTGTRYEMAAKHSADTHRAQSSIPLSRVDSLIQDAPSGSSIVCVELVEGATPLPEFQHPDNAFYIFGPESGDATKEMVAKADAVVYIPTSGCLNLAQTVNVVLYDRVAKSPDTAASDELVRASRGGNNRLSLHRIRRHQEREARRLQRKLDK